MEQKSYALVPEREDAGKRLDHFLAERITTLSRTVLRQVIEVGGVHAGGRRVRRCAYQVRAGEAIEVFLDGRPLVPFVLTADTILFRDRYLLAVNKPAGIETQPTPARIRGTLYEALLTHLRDPFRPLDRPSLGMAQRLDRDTSGVLVFSIHPQAHRGLTAALAGRQVGKAYLALVAGKMEAPAGEIRSLLARSRSTNRMKSVAKGGKEAVTRYRLVEQFPAAALLEIDILTGRSHQIRAHLSEAGHPLLGDTRYGGAAVAAGRPVPRQMLHAWRLTLQHPLDATTLALEAQVPEDFAELLEALRASPEDA